MDLDGDEVESVQSVCTLSLQEIGAQISEHPMPQKIDRNGVWIDIWPEHWGMTMRQIRKLMDECKDDPDWHQNNSVRDMVKHHILPRTAGTGLGYALKVNHESPLEVAVLVSHSWNENAEEFVETLERTVGADEILFVCAFAIYQNEDGAGPTVSQQIGASMNCSPFGRVLENIQEQAHKAGWCGGHVAPFTLYQAWPCSWPLEFICFRSWLVVVCPDSKICLYLNKRKVRYAVAGAVLGKEHALQPNG